MFYKLYLTWHPLCVSQYSGLSVFELTFTHPVYV